MLVTDEKHPSYPKECLVKENKIPFKLLHILQH